MLFKQRERVTAFAWTGKAVTSRNIKEKKKKTVTQQTVQKNYTSNPCADKNIIPRIWDSSPNQNGSTLRSEEVFFCFVFLKYRPLFLFFFVFFTVCTCWVDQIEAFRWVHFDLQWKLPNSCRIQSLKKSYKQV